MFWKRKKTEAPRRTCDLLLGGGGATGEVEAERTPKGYVPMLVGSEDAGDDVERVLVHVSLLKEASFCALLDMAAQEYGYRSQGVIRIPQSSLCFRKMVSAITTSAR